MITQEQINQVVRTLVDGYHPTKIILFGSYATGNPTPDSDLDLLLVKDDELSKIERNRKARSFLKDLFFPVDVFVKGSREFETYKNVVGTIVYAAHKYGRVLYEA